MMQTAFRMVAESFLGGAPAWYKRAIVLFLVLNPLLFSLDPYIAGWALVLEFIFALGMALRCYPLQPGGLLALEAVAIGMTSTDRVFEETLGAIEVVLLLIFMVAGIYFLKDLLRFTFTKLVTRVRSKVLLALMFTLAAAVLSAFLDALTVIAVVITVATAFYGVYHTVASGKHGHHDYHDHADDRQVPELKREELDQFRAFLRSLLLIVIDPTTTSQPALDRIAHLPRPVSAQIMLLICDYEPTLGSGYHLPAAAAAAARESALARHRRRLEVLAAPLLAEGFDVRTDASWDYPLHEAIIRKAVEWGADLVVKDTHHHSVLRRSIFSNTDWNLIRHCPMRLLLVKPRPIGHIPCVVAAVDPLHPRDKEATLDDRIVTAANELAHMFGGQTSLLHTFDVSPVIMTADGLAMPIALPVAQIAAELEKNCTEAMRVLAKKHGIPRERVHVLQGQTRELLVSSTDELHADIVVMGAISRSAMERLFVGSTAEAVLDKLHCDVSIVKPSTFAASVADSPRSVTDYGRSAVRGH